MGRGESKVQRHERYLRTKDRGSSIVTDSQQRTINSIANKTRKLKNEQYRIVDESGNVVLTKRGDSGSVAATVGEKRDNMPGAVSIHNHPDGGTFSADDLTDFGYGARAIVAATPEGNYTLVNVKYGAKDQTSGWLAMQRDMEAKGITDDVSFTQIKRQTENTPRVKKQAKKLGNISQRWIDARNAGKPQAVLDRLMSEYDKESVIYRAIFQEEQRKQETKPYHNYYKKYARKYGFDYSFNKK